MPSSPKKTPKTGSVLLGQELKRLRGGRSLREICELTKKPPLASHVAPLSEAGLCEIESGKSMPLLATLHTLSIVYKTSMNQLMSYVTEERLVAAPMTGAVAEAQFTRAFAAQNWYEALSVCLAAERSTVSERERIAWRGNRASCLSRIGLGDEAMALYAECCESPALLPHQRFKLLCSIASCQAIRGMLWAATVSLREAAALASEERISSTEIAQLELMRAELLIGRHYFGLSTDERELREALRLLEKAEASWPAEEDARKLELALSRAFALFLMGNSLVAERDARNIKTVAENCRLTVTQARACVLTGLISAKAHRTHDAVEAFEVALRLADSTGATDLAFEVNYRLFELLSEARPGRATAAFRACSVLYPVLSARSPLVAAYEQAARGRS